MKPIKGVLCALVAMFLCQASFAQSTKSHQVSLSPAGHLVIEDSKGKSFTFKSITLQGDAEIDGIKYRISYGPGVNSGEMVAILQPADTVKITVKDENYPTTAVGISPNALAIFTFNVLNHTLVVEAGSLGTVTVNNATLKPGERVSVGTGGTLVRNFGSGSGVINPTGQNVADRNGNAGGRNTPGQTADTKDQPRPEVTDFEFGPGWGNNLLAKFAINLNPQASTPFLPGQ